MVNRTQITEREALGVQPATSAKKDALRLLSIPMAAQYTGVSATTVRRWIKSGHLKIYRAGRQIRVDERDLIEFLSPEPLKWL